MLRKRCFFLFILLFSCIFCLTNTFADENGEPLDIEKIIEEGDFDIPQDDPEFHIVPEAIIGDPDFEKMRDLPPESQDYQLGRKVGMLLIRNARGQGYWCTGFLVGPDLFLTNYHCIYEETVPRPIGTAEIFMDYYQDRNDDGTLGGTTARVSAIVHANAEKGYALLRLDKSIGNTYGWLELDTTVDADDTGQRVKLISHSNGRSKEIVRRNARVLALTPVSRARFPHFIVYSADTEGGSSGAPVFLHGGTGVIALHHAGVNNRNTGEPLYNAGNLMSHIVPEIEQYLPEPPVMVYMYWTDSSTDKVQRANLDGSNIEDIITTGLRTPRGIAVDPEGGKIYWTDSGTDTIQRSDFDGSNIEDLITTGLRTPTSIALDLVNSKMYWTDTGTDKVQRANLDGSNIEDLITTGLRTPTSIALDAYDPNLGKVYWTDSGTDKVQRVNFDGSNIQDLVTTGLGTPTSIALDLENGKMYWTDSGTDKVQRANLDGSHIEDIVTIGLRTPKGIAVDPEGGKIYWVDSGTDTIQRANLDGSNIDDLVTTGLRTPTGIALGIPQMVSANPLEPEPDPGSVDVNGDGQVTVIDLAMVCPVLWDPGTRRCESACGCQCRWRCEHIGPHGCRPRD